MTDAELEKLKENGISAKGTILTIRILILTLIISRKLRFFSLIFLSIL